LSQRVKASWPIIPYSTGLVKPWRQVLALTIILLQVRQLSIWSMDSDLMGFLLMEKLFSIFFLFLNFLFFFFFYIYCKKSIILIYILDHLQDGTCSNFFANFFRLNFQQLFCASSLSNWIIAIVPKHSPKRKKSWTLP
jgi:hypothetical protein